MAGDANGRALDTPARSTKIVVRPADQLRCGVHHTILAVIRTCHTSEAEAEVDHAFGDVAAPLAVASVESGEQDQDR